MYRTKLAQDLASQPGLTAEGRGDRMSVARNERRIGAIKTGAIIAGSAALIAVGAAVAPEGTMDLKDPGAREQGTNQVGNVPADIDPNEPIQIDKNGLPYIEDEPPK